MFSLFLFMGHGYFLSESWMGIRTHNHVLDFSDITFLFVYPAFRPLCWALVSCFEAW